MTERAEVAAETGTPAFSVLIAAYNSESTLGETLDSLIAQTWTDWEAIVVDDGSTDSTAAAAARYAAADPRIKVVSQPNGGTGSARNTAAQAASAPFLALLDADDRYLPEYLERMADFIARHPDYGIYSVDGFLQRPNGDVVPDNLHPDSVVRSYSAEDLLVRNRIRVHNVMRREVFDLIGGFDEDPRLTMEDYDFWLRALIAGARHIHNPERLKVYRRGEVRKTADRVSCCESDILMLSNLLRGGTLTKDQARVARRTRADTIRVRDRLIATRARAELTERLAAGDFASARSLYWRSRRGRQSGSRFAIGLAIMLLSPRLFARLLTGRDGRDGQTGSSSPTVQ